jgi:hypothetical protein
VGALRSRRFAESKQLELKFARHNFSFSDIITGINCQGNRGAGIRRSGNALEPAAEFALARSRQIVLAGATPAAIHPPG